MLLRAITGLMCVCLAMMLKAQSPASPDSLRISPEKYIAAVKAKAGGLEEKLDKKSAKALAQIKKQEEIIYQSI